MAPRARVRLNLKRDAMNSGENQRQSIEKIDSSRPSGPPNREFQELWFSLARRRWTSLVLVPAGEGESTLNVARSLADVGRWLRQHSITVFLMSDPMDYASANQIVADPLSSTGSGDGKGDDKVIVSVQPVIQQPLGLAVTYAADLVVLCIEMGRTRVADVRRTIELIGRERIAGCFVTR